MNDNGLSYIDLFVGDQQDGIEMAMRMRIYGWLRK